MKCVNGIWYHRGQRYATLHEALVAAWPREPLQASGEKNAAPGISSTGGGGVKKVFESACFASENTTGKEVLQEWTALNP